MAESILRTGNTEVVFDTTGAYITTLKYHGSDILFPRQRITTSTGEEKLRGGCHVCLPQFGPGGDNGLNQHGFGRELEWKVENHAETLLELQLTNEDPRYRVMTARLLYLLTENELSMQLTLQNTGNAPLPVAPAFHPYFAHNNYDVLLNGTLLDLASLAGTEFTTAETHTLEVQGRQLQLTSTNLAVWAVWTDQLGEYICVEPSHSGNSFIDSIHGAPDELAAGQSKSYRFTLRW